MSDFGSGGGTSFSSGSGSSSSTSTPQFIPNPVTDFNMQLAQMDQQIGIQLVQWGLDQFNNLVTLTDPIINSLTGLANNMYTQANQYYSTFQNEFQPVIDQWVQQAKTFASPERIAQAEGQTESDVNQGMDAARIAAESNLDSFGIDPGSGKFPELELAQRTQGAAAAVGQAELARQRIEDTQRQMMQYAINTGIQYPAMSVNAANAGTQANSIAGQIGIGRLTAGANAVNTGAPWKAPYVQAPIGQASRGQSQQSNNSRSQQPQRKQNDPNQGNQGNGNGNNGNGPRGPALPPPPKPDPGTFNKPPGQPDMEDPTAQPWDAPPVPWLPGTDTNSMSGYSPYVYNMGPDGGYPDYVGQGVNGFGTFTGAPQSGIDPTDLPNWNANDPNLPPQGWDPNAPEPGAPPPNGSGWSPPPDQIDPATGKYDPNIIQDNVPLPPADPRNTYFDPSGGNTVTPAGINDPYGPIDQPAMPNYQSSIDYNQYADNTNANTMNDATQSYFGPDQQYQPPDMSGGMDTSGSDFGYQPPQDYQPPDYAPPPDLNSGGPDLSGMDYGYTPPSDTNSYDTSGYTQPDFSGMDFGGDGGGDFAKGGRVNASPTTGGHVPRSASPSQGRQTDDIPARLNAGEYVIPRDVTMFKGHQFFDNLIKKSREAFGQGAGPKPQPKMGAPISGPPRFVSRPVQSAAPGGGIRAIPPMARPFSGPRFVPPARGRPGPVVRPGNFAGAPYGRK